MSHTMSFLLGVFVLVTVASEDLDTTYHGCWYLTEAQFGVWGPWRANLTIDACTTFCGDRGFSKVALKDGVECYCGDEELDQSNKALEKTCKVPCGGQEDHVCGGESSFSIWSVNRHVEGHADVQRVNVRFGIPSCSASAIRHVHNTTAVVLKEEFGALVEVLPPDQDACIFKEEEYAQFPLIISVNTVETDPSSIIINSFGDPKSHLMEELAKTDTNVTVASVTTTLYPKTRVVGWQGKIVVLVGALLIFASLLLGFFVWKTNSPQGILSQYNSSDPFFGMRDGVYSSSLSPKASEEMIPLVDRNGERSPHLSTY